MITQDKILENLKLDLLKNAEAYFVSMDRFES